MAVCDSVHVPELWQTCQNCKGLTVEVSLKLSGSVLAVLVWRCLGRYAERLEVEVMGLAFR